MFIAAPDMARGTPGQRASPKVERGQAGYRMFLSFSVSDKSIPAVQTKKYPVKKICRQNLSVNRHRDLFSLENLV